MSIVVATPDFRTYPMEPGIVSAVAQDRMVVVHRADGTRARFHAVWLRDNAAGPAYLDPHSRERVFDILDFGQDIVPGAVSAGDNGTLMVDWSDGTGPCAYHPGWLRTHCYDT